MTRKINHKAEWTHTTVGGSVSCWPLILKKRGSTQNGQTQCFGGTNWLYEMKKKGEENRMEVQHQKLESNDSQC